MAYAGMALLASTARKRSAFSMVSRVLRLPSTLDCCELWATELVGVSLVLPVDSVVDASGTRVGAELLSGDTDRGRRLRVAYLTAADMAAG